MADLKDEGPPGEEQTYAGEAVEESQEPASKEASSEQMGSSGNSNDNPEGDDKTQPPEKTTSAEEDDTELRKNTSLGNILSGLSSGTFGKKAKENTVVVEERPRKRFMDGGNNWGPNKRYRGGGMGMGGGGGWGMWGGDRGDGGWGGNSWNQYGYDQQYGYDNYGHDNFGRGYNDYEGGYDNYEGYEEESGNYDEGSEEYLAEEMKLLEKEYGVGQISAKMIDSQGLVYVCEICQVNLNGRKSLSNHFDGMKHLKRKKLWEKKQKMLKFDDIESLESKEKDSKDISVLPTPSAAVPPPKAAAPPPPVAAAPPPPPPVAPVAPIEEKPKEKSNLSGGATGTLLKKLAACAVKNLKDCDLATNVIIGLVRTMKDYIHGKGDTRAIEILTEIDVKLKGIKPKMLPTETEKSKSKEKTDTSNLPAKVAPSNPPPSAASQSSSNLSQQSGYSYPPPTYSSQAAGSWYPQEKANTLAAQQYSTGIKAPPPNTSYTSGYTTNMKPNSSYLPSHLPPTLTKNMTSGKDVSGYPSQPLSYTNQPPPAVANIISATSAPPPPPPVNSANNAVYGNTGNNTAYGYGGYYMGGNAAPQGSHGYGPNA